MHPEWGSHVYGQKNTKNHHFFKKLCFFSCFLGQNIPLFGSPGDYHRVKTIGDPHKHYFTSIYHESCTHPPSYPPKYTDFWSKSVFRHFFFMTDLGSPTVINSMLHGYNWRIVVPLWSYKSPVPVLGHYLMWSYKKSLKTRFCNHFSENYMYIFVLWLG